MNVYGKVNLIMLIYRESTVAKTSLSNKASICQGYKASGSLVSDYLSCQSAPMRGNNTLFINSHVSGQSVFCPGLVYRERARMNANKHNRKCFSRIFPLFFLLLTETELEILLIKLATLVL